MKNIQSNTAPRSQFTAHSSQFTAPSSPITKKWYAIYVRSRHEKVIDSELRLKGIESSLPLMTTIRQWSDRRKKVEVPLFRGYLFVKIELKTEKLSVLQTNGVVKFVDFNRNVVIIPEQQMYWLNQMVDSKLGLHPEQNLPIGSEVDVLVGPLRGLRGRVKQKNSRTRLVVWIDSIMQGVSVELDLACLSPTSPKTRHIRSAHTGEYIV
ncbi:MAG: UpxY family transcription antiterminator [Candidatus Marinimicrobia bacterium]|jgi:transcription antitermination factor NusG|nr:UpxY family transcription antiterminator [Candidatus Neomarinimicrobiota bacterium]MBT6000473.1 UpxY family transcription antiterminator [Candidatus Neomarinimicrobiota bacterium]MBT6708878.1 UpxY family transcription antiterminator [Candidatus Neomarinimicrobiota bacterium]MBT7872447.1 UpxY family transcription antiterminator [Candidatus Neomarinimicrobiota bacterium]